MSKKVKSNIMTFSSFVNENYTFEDFTSGDMEDVKDLYNDGIVDAKEISRETGLNIDIVTQILYTIAKKNESEVFGEHEEQQTDCDCDICNCVGKCNCDCCCSDNDDDDDDETELLYCKDCGKYIGGLQTNLCVGCSNQNE